jgi:hypothetical protein
MGSRKNVIQKSNLKVAAKHGLKSGRKLIEDNKQEIG